MRINFNKYFNNIIFNEELHIYTVNEENYISVTQFISKFKPDTFGGSFTEDYCFKNNLDIDYIKKLWQIKSSVSCIKGTELHFYIESFYKYKLENEYSNLIDVEVEYFKNFYNDNKNLIYVKSEYICYDTDYKIAGTIDGLFFDTITKNYVLIDWKTNKKLELNNKYGTYLLDPLNNVHNSELNVYSLQLSLYKRLLEKNIPDLHIDKLIVVHFNRNNDNYKKIELKFYEKEIDKILKIITKGGVD